MSGSVIVTQNQVRKADAGCACRCETAGSRYDYSGTCALTVLIRGSRLVVHNAGDCRAVLVRPSVSTGKSAESSQSRAIAIATPQGLTVEVLSRDHTPESEKARIEAAGGWVTIERELNIQRLKTVGGANQGLWVIVDPHFLPPF